MIDLRARLDATGRHAAVAWILAAAFVAFGVADVVAGRHLHDEGQLTLLFARLFAEAPLDVFFWQKSRPPISLLYAPFASLGPVAFGVAHIVVAALGIVALARIAAHLGHRWPNAAALVLAASPLYFACAASGVSNSDGVAFALVGSWLWHGRGRVTAGAFVLGMVPWIRAELAPLVLVLAIACPREQRRRAWPAIVAFGLAYGLAGAVFHRDALWWAYYPPALPSPMTDHPLWARENASLDAAEIATTLLALTPVWLLAVPWRTGSATPKLQWVWLGFAAFELGMLLAMPRWRAFNFDLSPRYLLGVMPGLALAASSAIATLAERASSRTRIAEACVLLGGAALALAAAAHGRHPTALAATAVVAMAVAIGRAGFGGPAALVAVALVLVGPSGFADGSKLATSRTSPELLLAERRLAQDPALANRPIYTNLPLLSARLRDPEVHYIVQTDQLHEIVTLTNPINGQRSRVLAALEHGFFGTPVFPGAMTPEQLPPDALLLLQDDPRLPAAMPPATWEPALRILSQSPTLRIAELARGRSR